jgi:hypothetical protein
MVPCDPAKERLDRWRLAPSSYGSTQVVDPQVKVGRRKRKPQARLFLRSSRAGRTSATTAKAPRPPASGNCGTPVAEIVDV